MLKTNEKTSDKKRIQYLMLVKNCRQFLYVSTSDLQIIWQLAVRAKIVQVLIDQIGMLSIKPKFVDLNSCLIRPCYIRRINKLVQFLNCERLVLMF